MKPRRIMATLTDLDGPNAPVHTSFTVSTSDPEETLRHLTEWAARRVRSMLADVVVDIEPDATMDDE